MSAFYTCDNLWSPAQQPRRIFGWSEILRDWNNILNMPLYVQTILNNLKASSDPDSTYDFPLSHYLTFLNNEPEAIRWFLYEVVSVRWMWGEIRLDYVRQLAEIIDLDARFPEFPGSPQNSRTVREFLEEHLTSDELRIMDLMPRIIPAPSLRVNRYLPPYQRRVVTETDDAQSDSTDSQDEEDEAEPLPNYAWFVMRFLRQGEGNKTKRNSDDILRITKDAGFDRYTYTYISKADDVRQELTSLTSGQVLRRVRLALRAAVMDDDPFCSVQVDCPAAPQMLFGVDRLTSDVRDLVYDNLETCFETWPVNA